ncbi:MAG: hypothetical protein NT088_04530 [Candidatus Omnitrophica bacterium]|nr:hypothetical protein [Candidatus Omnitrophota bacterium]
MKFNKIIFASATCIAGLFLWVVLPKAFSQDESQSSSVVATEPQVQAHGDVVDAGTEEVIANEQVNTGKDDSNAQASDDKSTDNSADKGQVSAADQQKKDDDSKYLYKRRGRQPPVYR